MALPRRTANRWRDLDVADAVALRGWALDALSSLTRDGGTPPHTPRVSPVAWELFLEAEACAIALSRARPGRSPALPPETRAALEAAAGSELKRVLAARAQLQALGALAGRLGIRVVALKGAVPVAAGHDLSLEDIDLLTSPEGAERLASALDATGYAPTGGGSPHHLRTRILPGGLGVEIHVSLHHDGRPVPGELTAASLPLAGAAGLRRLAPAEHAWHVLSHVAIEHPDRRGRIRDLLLIADALDACSDPDQRVLDDRVQRHASRDVLAGLLAMARAIRGRSTVADAFRRSAASRYELRALLDRLRLPEALLERTWLWAVALLGSRDDRRRLWGEMKRRNLAPSKYRLISVIEERTPRLGGAWILFWRSLRLVAVVPLAALLARLARSRTRCYESEPRPTARPDYLNSRA